MDIIMNCGGSEPCNSPYCRNHRYPELLEMLNDAWDAIFALTEDAVRPMNERTHSAIVQKAVHDATTHPRLRRLPI